MEIAPIPPDHARSNLLAGCYSIPWVVGTVQASWKTEVAVQWTRSDSRTLASGAAEEEAGEQVVGEVVMERQVLGLDLQDNIRLRWENLGPGTTVREWEFVSERKIGAVRREHIAEYICRDLVQ